MFYRLLKSAFVDQLAYATAFVAALWAFADKHHPPVIPTFLNGVSPLYGVAVSSFAGALLICKYVFMAGEAQVVDRLKDTLAQRESMLAERDAAVTDLTERLAMSVATENAAKNRLDVFENRDTEFQISELRKKIRTLEDDKKTALTAAVSSMKDQIRQLRGIEDEQVQHAVDVLNREMGLLETEIKKGELSLYELSLKVTELRENIYDLSLIALSGTSEGKQTAEEAALNFFRMDKNSDPFSMEQTYKFLKVAFHPDRFSSDALKQDAKKYFQQTVQAYNSLKERVKTSP
ncbi:MAG: hypothetical protein WCP10_11525 [Desulfuromonadales bacterium]